MLPFFRDPKTIGIDISDNSIEAVVLDKDARVTSYARAVLQQGIVEEGIVLDTKKLALILKSLLLQAKPEPLDSSAMHLRAVISIPESQTFLHLFTAPSELQGNALKEYITSEAAKLIPIEQHALYSDILPLRASEHEHTQLVLYAGAQKKVIDTYRLLLAESGIKAFICDVESLSIGRALAVEGKGSVLIVDIGARTTGLSIFDENGTFNISILLRIGGNDFTDAIASAEQVSIAEAEKTKKITGLDPAPKNKTIFGILKEQFKEISAEISEALQFYEEHTKKRVERILLTGGSVLMPKLDEYLSKELGREVSIGGPLDRIANPDTFIGEHHPTLYTNVIGLALRGIDEPSIGINLFSQLKPPSSMISMNSYKQTDREYQPANLRKKIAAPKIVIPFFIFSCAFFAYVAYEYAYKPFASRPAVKVAHVDNVSDVQSTTSFATSTDTVLSTTTPVQNDTEIDIIKSALIRETPTGWLNVRAGPGTNYDLVQKIYPGSTYTINEERSGWIKLHIKKGVEGWVTNQYVIIK